MVSRQYPHRTKRSGRAELLSGNKDMVVDEVGSAKAELAQRFAARFDIWRALYDRYVQPVIDQALNDTGDDNMRATEGCAREDTASDVAEYLAENEGLEHVHLGKRKAGGVAARIAKRSRRGVESASALLFESSELNLPSRYGRAVIDHPVMQQAVQVERLLREGQANDALDDLRTRLITSYAVKQQKRAGSGQIHNTRANGKIKIKMKAVGDAADRYRTARERLVVLGMSKEDTTYRALHSSDVVAFKVYSAEEQLGDSRKQPSWIWSDFRFVQGEEAGIRAYCEESEFAFHVSVERMLKAL